MKKKSFFTFVLITIMALVLSACGGGAAKNGVNNANQDNEKKASLLQEIKDRGVMKVGVM